MAFAPIGTAWLGDDEPSRDAAVRVAGGLAGERILVPLVDPSVSAVTDQIGVAATLARTHDASLQVTNPVALPRQVPSEFHERVTDDAETQLLEWALAEVRDSRVAATGTLLYHRRLARRIIDAVASHDADAVVLPGGSWGGLRRGVPERVAVHTDADAVVVNGQPGYHDVASILLPVGGGPHSGLAADVARRVAADCDAWIDVLHVVEEAAPEARREAAQACVEAAAQRIDRSETTTTWVLEAEDVAGAIIEQSRYYGLTVMGAPTKGRLRQFVFGSTTNDVRADARSLVLMARNNSRNRGGVAE